MARPPSPDLWIRRVDRLAQMPIVQGHVIPIHVRLGIGAVMPIEPGQRVALRTGLMFDVPLDHVLQLHAPAELSDRGVLLSKTAVLPGERTELIVTIVHGDRFGHPFDVRNGQVCAIGILAQTLAVGPFKP